MKKIVLLSPAFILLVLLTGFASGIHLQVDTDHNGRINVLKYSKSGNLLFSAGKDGTVRVWDIKVKKLINLIRISYLPLKMIALNPVKKQVAVLETDDISIFRISLWNWESGKIIFSYKLQSRPLFLTFSSQGNFLVAGEPNWQSLVVLNAENGKEDEIARDIHGIVSFVTFSKNEKTMLIYQPSGKLLYWDIRTGETIKEISTFPNLSHIALSEDKRFFVAVYQESLVYIDLLSGIAVSRIESKGVVKTSISSGGSEVAGIVQQDGKTLVKRYLILNKSFYELGVSVQESENGISSLTYGGNDLFLGYKNGSIMLMLPDGSYNKFTGNRLAEISNLYVFKNRLYVITPEKIYIFNSDFFNKPLSNFEKNSFAMSLKILPNPLESPTGIILFSPDNLLLWRKGAAPGKVLSTDPEMTYIDDFLNFGSSLLSLETYKNLVISVQDTGQCLVNNMDTGKTEFTYFAPGMRKLIMLDTTKMIGIKSRIGTYETPLVLINPETGETVPIPDTSHYIYEAAYDSISGKLFTIGVEKIDGKSYTIVKAHDGKLFDRSHIMDKFKGEDLAASIAVNNKNDTVYSSLGYRSITSYRYGLKQVFETDTEIPRNLFISGDKVISLNRNSTITVRYAKTGAVLFTFYLFKDDNWVLLLKQRGMYPAGYYASADGDRLINAVSQGRILNNYTKYYKLKFKD